MAEPINQPVGDNSWQVERALSMVWSNRTKGHIGLHAIFGEPRAVDQLAQSQEEGQSKPPECHGIPTWHFYVYTAIMVIVPLAIVLPLTVWLPASKPATDDLASPSMRLPDLSYHLDMGGAL